MVPGGENCQREVELPMTSFNALHDAAVDHIKVACPHLQDVTPRKVEWEDERLLVYVSGFHKDNGTKYEFEVWVSPNGETSLRAITECYAQLRFGRKIQSNVAKARPAWLAFLLTLWKRARAP